MHQSFKNVVLCCYLPKTSKCASGLKSSNTANTLSCVAKSDFTTKTVQDSIKKGDSREEKKDCKDCKD